MSNFVESIVDMCTIEDTPVMHAIVEGMAALIESGDIGYTGNLHISSEPSRAAIYNYMDKHPECATREDAVKALKAARAKFANNLVYRTPTTDPVKQHTAALADLMAERETSSVGKFFTIPRSYGAIGKVVREYRENGETMLDLDCVTRGGEKYSEKGMPLYGMDECTDQAKIDRWNLAHGITPTPAATTNAVPSGPAAGFRFNDEVKVNAGRYIGFVGKYRGENTPGYAALEINVFGNPQVVDVPFSQVTNLDATSAAAATVKSRPHPAPGHTVRTAVWKPRR